MGFEVSVVESQDCLSLCLSGPSRSFSAPKAIETAGQTSILRESRCAYLGPRTQNQKEGRGTPKARGCVAEVPRHLAPGILTRVPQGREAGQNK